jgi:hypothetical protein
MRGLEEPTAVIVARAMTLHTGYQSYSELQMKCWGNMPESRPGGGVRARGTSILLVPRHKFAVTEFRGKG